ncbi:MAG: hypothetical protein KJ879_00835 [Nanoarchaeota archaeon]|nr:hypothetical protein [Nanoarchaeota archaeon]
MENVLIVNKERFEELRDNFKKDGVEKLHVLADFDRTLTKTFVNGKKIPSLISILRDENYLTPDYPEKAKALFKKYNPIEIDPSISLEEKVKAMEGWWTKHFQLLIASGLNMKDIERAMESSNLIFRDRVSELLDILKDNDIPLVILSSSGIGKESIVSYLKNKQKLFENIHIISNSFNWDKNGKAISVNQPVIHGTNKNEIVIDSFPEIYNMVEDRKNVILLGDSLSDVDMITGFNYDNLIKIGFLNENIEKNLENYKQKYDVLILNDSSAEFIVNLLQEIL